MRMILAVIVFLVIGVGPRWEKYKNEKVAAYQAQHGGEVCKVKNIFIVVECRPFTREEREAKEQAEALQRWLAFNERVSKNEFTPSVRHKIDCGVGYESFRVMRSAKPEAKRQAQRQGVQHG